METLDDDGDRQRQTLRQTDRQRQTLRQTDRDLQEWRHSMMVVASMK